MTDVRQIGTRSAAAVAGHPIHPMLVGFPIAFFFGVFASDAANWATADPFWARASFWLLVAGLITGLAAAVAGLVDFLARPRIRRTAAAWFHFAGNGIVMMVSALNLALRWDATAIISGGAFGLSAVVCVLLVGTGWLGGEMVYKHGFGMNGPSGVDGADASKTASETAAPKLAKRM